MKRIAFAAGMLVLSAIPAAAETCNGSMTFKRHLDLPSAYACARYVERLSNDLLLRARVTRDGTQVYIEEQVEGVVTNVTITCVSSHYARIHAFTTRACRNKVNGIKEVFRRGNVIRD